VDMPTPRASGDGTLRPEIASSWERVRMTGLAPDAQLDRVDIADVDRSTRLMAAATPVLDELTTQLFDTTLCLALADRHCRIVDRRFTDRRVERALDQVGAVIGCQFTEDVAGTNSVSTTFELRRAR
jgi:sigma-54 dependent transcriptional regulator, acetoin dehydrogenase operon transcriptional activator AcoR